MTAAWPWKGDTIAERARRIANALYALLPDDAVKKTVRAQAHAMGERWLGEDILRYGPEDVVTTKEASHLVFRGESTIRKWHSDGDLPNVRKGMYRVCDVMDCDARKRVRRQQRGGLAA